MHAINLEASALAASASDAAPSSPLHHVHIATACLFNPLGQLLTVRKRGTQAWMLPGGKRDGDETPHQALVRELAEELQLHCTADDFEVLGPFSAPAANEADTLVHAHVFVARTPLQQPVHIAAEIEGLRWQALEGNLPGDLAPLLHTQVIPALLARR